MFSMCKFAGLFAIALTTTACVSFNNSSQNAVSETQRPIYTVAQAATPVAEPASDQLNFFAQEQTVVATNTAFAGVASQYEVVDVHVAVQEYLVVSEADVYVPKADIVWREDALTKGTSVLVGPRKVVMAVRVNMFHALTEKARQTVGGKHNAQFDYVLLDAASRS